MSDTENPEENHYVWIARYEDGRLNDKLRIGDTDCLSDHAPAIAASETAKVEYVGTFKEFADSRDEYDLDLRKMVGFDSSVTTEIGRGRFWDVVWGDN